MFLTNKTSCFNLQLSSYVGTIVPEDGMQTAVAGVHNTLCMATDEDGMQIAVDVHETSCMTTEEDCIQIAVGLHETSCMTMDEDGMQIAVGLHETSCMTTKEDGKQIAVGVHETSCMTTEEDGKQIAVGVHETSCMTTEQNMHVPILLLYNQCRRQRPILPFCWLNTAQLAWISTEQQKKGSKLTNEYECISKHRLRNSEGTRTRQL